MYTEDEKRRHLELTWQHSLLRNSHLKRACAKKWKERPVANYVKERQGNNREQKEQRPECAEAFEEKKIKGR